MMNTFILYRAILFPLLFAVMNCHSQPKIADIEQPPRVVEADEKYADVFKPLDGKWQGQFFIYVDTLGQRNGDSQPKQLDSIRLNDLPLKLETVIDVEQHYTSESRYFQRVTIRDTYTNEQGERQVVESRGVNKTQDGKMWCVMVKPDETVIHSGKMAGKHTIIWQRDLLEPLKIEYFRETVKDNEYSILGWGYYGDDNPTLSPRIWFQGKYKRVD